MKLGPTERKILLFSIVIFILVGLPYVFSGRQVWFDESYSYLYSRQNLAYIVSPHDVHPPTYYLMLKGWTGLFGVEDWAMRSLSLCTGVIALIFMFYIIKEMFPGEQWRKIWGYFFAIYVFSSTTMHFFSEIRMYSLAIMLTTMSFYFMIRFIKSDGKKFCGLFLLFSAIMMFVHYYTMLFFIVECVYILISLRKKLISVPFIIYGSVFAMYLIFLVTYFLAQRSRIFGLWFADSDWYSLLSTFYYYFFHSWGIAIPAIDTIYGMIFVIGYIILIIWGISVAEADNKKYMMLLALFMILPPFVGMVVNDLIMPVYHHRLFIFGAWCTILLLSASLYELRKRRVRLFLSVIILIAMLVAVNAVTYFTTFDSEVKEANQYLVDHGICQTNATIIHESMFSLGPALYYQARNKCDNVQRIYVEIPPEARHSAGFDAIGDWRIFENADASQFLPFYYFASNNNIANESECEILYGQELSGPKGGLYVKHCVGVKQ